MLLKYILPEMYSNVVLSVFEIYPYEIYIVQNSNGDLLTLKTYKNVERW